MQSTRSKILFHLVIGALLTLVYAWNDLFTGNQQVYFLWAADLADFGNFQSDPLLNQADPFPLFSLLASGIFKVLPLSFFHVIYLGLNCIYAYALFGISDRYTGIYNRFRTTFLFTILFLTLHSAELWGTFFNGLTGHDLRWIWDSGLAEQGVLRGYLQPSAFGVFLLLGCYHLVKKNQLFAALSFAVASLFHANYLILGWASLSLVLPILFYRKQLGKTDWIAVGTYAISTVPYVIYLALEFLPDSETTKAVTGNLEGNPHLDLATWINLKTGLQLAVFGLSLFFFRKTVIGKWMMTMFGFMTALSILVFLMPDLPLLSINPWRISVVLFPIGIAMILGLITQALRPGNYVGILLLPLTVSCIALIQFRLFGSGDAEYLKVWSAATLFLIFVSAALGWLVKKLPDGFLTQVKNTQAFGLIILLIASGVIGKFIEKRTIKEQPWSGASAFVTSNGKPGDLYLIPPHINNFRMNARVAIVSDPLVVHGSTLGNQYKRNVDAAACFEGDVFIRSKASLLTELPITHVLTRNPEHQETVIYQDENFAIVKLK